MTNRIPLGDLWGETTAFVRSEFPLILPVACLGFGVPLVLLLLAVPVEQAESGQLVPGAWMAWFLPCGLLTMFGSLGLSALALRPGGTVAEALALAVRRLPVGVALCLFYVGLQVAMGIVVALLTHVDIALSGHAGVLAMIGNLALLAVVIWLSVRVMPIWALLADCPIGAWPALRACLALSRPWYRTLLLVRIVGGVAGMIALFVLLVPLGAIARLAGIATGANGVATIVSYILTGFAFALLAAVWTIYVARLYRRLAGSSSGM